MFLRRIFDVPPAAPCDCSLRECQVRIFPLPAGGRGEITCCAVMIRVSYAPDGVHRAIGPAQSAFSRRLPSASAARHSPAAPAAGGAAVLRSQLTIHVSLFFFAVGVLRIFFYFRCASQHLRGSFQFALPAATLLTSPHGCGRSRQKRVSSRWRTPPTPCQARWVTVANINVVVAPAFTVFPAFFFQPVQKIEHRGGARPLPRSFRQYPARWQGSRRAIPPA